MVLRFGHVGSSSHGLGLTLQSYFHDVTRSQHKRLLDKGDKGTLSDFSKRGHIKLTDVWKATDIWELKVRFIFVCFLSVKQSLDLSRLKKHIETLRCTQHGTWNESKSFRQFMKLSPLPELYPTPYPTGRHLVCCLEPYDQLLVPGSVSAGIPCMWRIPRRKSQRSCWWVWSCLWRSRAPWDTKEKRGHQWEVANKADRTKTVSHPWTLTNAPLLAIQLALTARWWKSCF